MKTRNPIGLLFGWLAMALSPGHAAVNSAGGTLTTSETTIVSGRITNQATGDTLPGALVQVEGTALSTVTDRGGLYTLSVPKGTRVLNVSYSGLDTARVELSALGGSMTKDVELTSEIYKLEAFKVAGVREGNALAIQTQRQSDNPKWVAAADTFGNPAANPGELIQRMPGISVDIVGGEVRTLYVRGMNNNFSSLLVDGDRVATSEGNAAGRNYQIEQLGTGNIESVELIKAPLPDQDANAVAGYVNLVSRRAFDQPGRRITLTAGVMWRMRDIEGSPFKDRADDLDLISLAYTDVFNVFGGEKNLGIAFNVNRRVSSTTQDEIGPQNLFPISQGFLNGDTANPLMRAWGMGETGYTAKAHNAGLSVDYKLSPDAYVFAKFSYNTNQQPQVAWRFGVGNGAATAANFAPDSTFEHSTLLPHAASVGISNAIPFFQKNARAFAFTTGTEMKLFQRSVTVDIRGNYSQADINYPGTINMRAMTTAGIGFEIDRRGQDEWYPIFRQTGGPSLTDPASYNMRSMTRQNFNAPNELYGARMDITKKFDTAAPTSLKVGAKYVDDERSLSTDLDAFTWVGADGIANSVDDAMTPYASLIYRQGNGRYGPFPFVTQPLDVPSGYWRQTAADAYNSYATSNASENKIREQITAAYIQGTMRLGALRVVGGVRMEETKTEGTAWVRNTTASWGGNSVGGASLDPNVVAANVARAQRSFVRRNTGTGKYRNFFPGLHFVYDAPRALLLRASYNRAISRPLVNQMLPTVTENPENMTITVGNPDLKPYNTDNFEVSVEKYFEPVGLFSVGAFLKEISDYTRAITSSVGPDGLDGGGLYANYTMSMTQNVGSARVRGIEASYQQQFSFLPGVLKGLGAFANFTYLDTKGNFGGLATSSRLANLSPRSGNAGLNYLYHGFDARILFNWTAEKYKATNGGIDIYNADRRHIDVKLQYRLSRYDVFLDVMNITDEPTRTDIALNGLRWYKTNQGVSFSAGVRARF